MASYIRLLDAYDHHIVVHTFPREQENVYPHLLGERSVLTGASLQNGFDETHERTVRWRKASEEAGRPWVVANDEQGSASLGVPPDPGYEGFAGKDHEGNEIRSLHDIRKFTLWGNLMAGGAGVEYYFGYRLPQNDLVMEDFRSRDKSWDYARIALDFFHRERIPFWQMTNMDMLVGNPVHDNSRYCFAKPGELYLVYLPSGGVPELNLSHTQGRFRVDWFNPRSGGTLQQGEITTVQGGGDVSLGAPPSDTSEDWLAVVRRM
jgi:hypothetical protein